MNYGSNSNDVGYLKVYFTTLTIFLALGLLPSLPIIFRNGVGIVLFAVRPEASEALGLSTQKDSTSDAPEDWDSEYWSEWIEYPNAGFHLKTGGKGRIEYAAMSSDPDRKIIDHYEKRFKKEGYSCDTERDGDTTIIKARKDNPRSTISVSVSISEGKIEALVTGKKQ